MKLLGMAGVARSGKDTVAHYLKYTHHFRTYAFADPLKEAASKMFGIPLEHFYDSKYKEVTDPFWGISPREMAQKLGTEGGRRVFGEDLWIKRAEQEWNDYKDQFNGKRDMSFYPDRDENGFIITDVRFENEADFIRKNNGIVIHVKRNSIEKVREHESENGIQILDNDIVIDNNGTVEELFEKAEHTYQLKIKGD